MNMPIAKCTILNVFYLLSKAMTGLIDYIIERECCEQPPVSNSSFNPLVGLSRASCAIPESHLYFLINFLLKVNRIGAVALALV